MHGLARANRHWTDDGWTSQRAAAHRLVWSGLGLVICGFWLTVLLLCF